MSSPDRIEALRAAYEQARLVSDAASDAFDAAKTTRAAVAYAAAAADAIARADAAKAALEAAEKENSQ